MQRNTSFESTTKIASASNAPHFQLRRSYAGTLIFNPRTGRNDTKLANGELIMHFPTRDVVLSKHFQDVMKAKARFFKLDSPAQLNQLRRTISARWRPNPISGDYDAVDMFNHVIAEGPTSDIILSKLGIDITNSKFI